MPSSSSNALPIPILNFFLSLPSIHNIWWCVLAPTLLAIQLLLSSTVHISQKLCAFRGRRQPARPLPPTRSAAAATSNCFNCLVNSWSLLRDAPWATCNVTISAFGIIYIILIYNCRCAGPKSPNLYVQNSSIGFCCYN